MSTIEEQKNRRSCYYVYICDVVLISTLSLIALATLKPQAAGYMAPGAERVSWVVLVDV